MIDLRFPYVARKHVDGEPVYWKHDSDTWTPDIGEASGFGDEAIWRGGLPNDAEDVVLRAIPDEVVITIERV